ncbi:Bacteroidetes-specific putative membrane protein [Ostertagia ostertagi]
MVSSGLMCTVESKAQDIHFSQFYENAIFRNPGLTGIFTGDYKAGVNYRTQWGNISNPFQTVLASVESRVRVSRETNDYLSIGLCASYDHAGSIDFNSLQVYPAINYNKSLEDRHGSYLSVGFTGGYIQRSVNMSKMTLDEQYMNGAYSASNPNGESFNYTRDSHFDLGAGDGDDISVITYGAGVHWATEYAEKHPGISLHILDLRSLLPLDYDAIKEAVKRTGKVLLLHEDTLIGGIGGEIAAWISEHCFEDLDAPIVRCGSLDTPVPFAIELEQNFMAKGRLDAAITKLMKF